MPGSNPEPRIQSLLAQDIQSGDRIHARWVSRSTPANSDVRCSPSRLSPRLAQRCSVAMNRDRCARGFHLPHLGPRTGIVRGTLQFRILIVRNDCKNGPNTELRDQFAETLPAARRMRRTKIVQSQQVLSGLRNQPKPPPCAPRLHAQTRRLPRRLHPHLAEYRATLWKEADRPVPQKYQCADRPERSRQRNPGHAQPAHQHQDSEPHPGPDSSMPHVREPGRCAAWRP